MATSLHEGPTNQLDLLIRAGKLPRAPAARRRPGCRAGGSAGTGRKGRRGSRGSRRALAGGEAMEGNQEVITLVAAGTACNRRCAAPAPGAGGPATAPAAAEVVVRRAAEFCGVCAVGARTRKCARLLSVRPPTSPGPPLLPPPPPRCLSGPAECRYRAQGHDPAFPGAAHPCASPPPCPPLPGALLNSALAARREEAPAGGGRGPRVRRGGRCPLPHARCVAEAARFPGVPRARRGRGGRRAPMGTTAVGGRGAVGRGGARRPPMGARRAPEWRLPRR